jgi:hypothetical protein
MWQLQEAAHKGRLYALHGLAIVCHITSGALGVVLARQSNPHVAAVSPLFEYVHSNGTSSRGLFNPIPRTEFTVGALSPLIWVEFITAGFHVLYVAALYSSWLDNFIRKRVINADESVNPLRWVEYAITATILSAFSNLNIGNASFYYWLKMVGDGLILQSFGLLLERLDFADKTQFMVANFVWKQAFVLNLVPVAVLLYQVFRSKVHTSIFYYNVVPYALWYQTFGVVAWERFLRSGNFASKWHTEMWYIILSLSTKLVVFWLGFGSFREISVNNGWAQPTPHVNWGSLRWSFAFVPFGLLFGYAGWTGDFGTLFKRLYTTSSAKNNETESVASIEARRPSYGPRSRRTYSISL